MLVLDVRYYENLMLEGERGMKLLRIRPDDRLSIRILAMPCHLLIKEDRVLVKWYICDVVTNDPDRGRAGAMEHDNLVHGIKSNHLAQHAFYPRNNASGNACYKRV
ncbi:hypothetical protein VE25_20060 [Devosia geojensis]|uniref:Uncharacterized protein n=1 Tax=Devosia geojensis TaxID=443610 RepID=A0A0F5FDM1_9HYPH|nr:hypothetical protein VE25_20060 [Devosia geojensis]